MGEFLMGKEVSGTPIETRQGVKAYSNFLQDLMKGGVSGTASQFQQLSTDALMALLANPQVAALLANPADRTSGLFAAMQPFEERETNRQVAGIRNAFGSAGGRFSRNVAGAEAITRGELSNQFARARQEALLTATGQNQNFLSNVLQAAGQNAQLSTLPFQAMSNFFQAGPPQFQQGVLPGLLSAATSIYTAKSLFGGGQPGGGGIPQAPPPVNIPSPSFPKPWYPWDTSSWGRRF